MTTPAKAKQPQDPALSDQRQQEIDKRVKQVAWGIALIWILFPAITFCISTTSTRGQFGDSYGMITSLFTGFTIVGLVYTILLQREDISIARSGLQKQHEDLELNREAVRLNTNELRESRNQMKWQRYDNTFFNLLELQANIIEGRSDMFARFHTAYILKLKDFTMYHLLRNAYNDNREAGNNGPTSICRLADEQFGRYIRNFEFIIEFIDDGKKIPENRLKYFKIFFAQLGINERLFLFYYFNLREAEPPKAYMEYKELLFQPLFTSTTIFHHHYMPIYNGSSDYHSGKSR